jgi:GDP-4-dehydro-6-deoxy-D-mannose reductase
VIAETRPALIFHLAGLIRSSDLAALLSLNVQATEHVLAAAAALPQLPRLFIAGSAAEYGLIDPAALPVSEEALPRPITCYGVSKLAQTALARARYFEAGLPIYVGRLFNVVGPGEPDSAFCSAMARQVAAIGLRLQEPVLHTGNLAPVRDFLDIRDVVSAYWAIITQGTPGRIYNVCSGTPTALTSVPSMLLELAGLSAHMVAEPARIQRADVPCSYGDSSRLRAETDWAPRYTLAASLADLLADWRNRLLAEQV